MFEFDLISNQEESIETKIMNDLHEKLSNRFKIHIPILSDKNKSLARALADHVYKRTIKDFLKIIGQDRAYKIIGEVVAKLGFR